MARVSVTGSTNWVGWTCLALVFLAIGGVLFQCLETQLIGFISDDGIYAMSALALSKGLGLKMLQLPTMPEQIRYPVGYPLLLVPIWWLFPKSPDNFWMFSASTAIWALLALFASERLLAKIFNWPLWARIMAIVAMSGNFFFLFHATTVMSEMPYLFFSLLTFDAAYRWFKAYQANTPTAGWWLLAACALAIGCFHLRILGVTLVAALGVWLLVLKQWRWAIGFGVTAALTTVIPWYLWIAVHKPATLTADNLPIIATITDYMTVMKLETFGHKLNGWLLYLTRLQMTLADTMLAFVAMLFPFITDHVTEKNAFTMWLGKTPWAILLEDILSLAVIFGIAGRFLLEGMQGVRLWRASGKGLTAQQAVIGLIGLYVAAYLLMSVLWAYPRQSYRFFIVILPLLWGLLMGAWPVVKPRLTACLLILALLWVPRGISMVWEVRTDHMLAYHQLLKNIWPDYKAAYRYVNDHIPKEAIIGTAHAVPLYLHTGHQGYHLYMDSFMRGIPLKDALDKLEQAMDKFSVRYVMLEINVINFELQKVPYNPVLNDLIVRAPKRYKVLYISPHKSVAVYERLPFEAPKHLAGR